MEIIHKEMGSDPASVAYQTIQYGVSNNHDVIIIDTAGRLHNKINLMNELSKIKRVVSSIASNCVIDVTLVIDGSTGQNAFEQAKQFSETTNVNSLVVTKLDGTARGGGALSAVATTGSPILFTGEGENVKDIEKFESDRFISRLLGMGDIQGLIDLAPEDMDEIEAMRLTQRMMSGRFTLNDMYTQMDMMSKIGTLDKFLSFLPAGMFGGMGQMSRKQKEEMQGNLERYRTIMDSMTEHEKNNPQVLKAERIKRVARGSGVTEKNVRELIAQWNKSRKMMKGIQGNRKMSKQMRKMMKSGDFEDLSM